MIASLTAAAIALLVPELAEAADGGAVVWWVWPLLLFAVTFVMAIVTVIAGLGGGTVFVPLVSSFFPFHIDFVRGAGLLVAVAGALASVPALLERKLADFRLALPAALITSAAAAVGARIGLQVPSHWLHVALGALVVTIGVVSLSARRSEFPVVDGPDSLARALGISGVYHEPTLGQAVPWTVHRTWQGFLVFVVVGLIGGVFGIGAGWASVPTLNLLMGAPLKVAAGTSMFLLGVNGSAAAWVYLNHGAMLPIVVIPSVLGAVLGSKIGVRILEDASPSVIRWMIGGVLLTAGLRSLLKGLGVWP
jgi:uncharacterized membrane protein YfcA